VGGVLVIDPALAADKKKRSPASNVCVPATTCPETITRTVCPTVFVVSANPATVA